MKIAMVNPPFRFSADPNQWITVPPQGYGAIQWVCAHLICGMRALGHEVTLLGAPGSSMPSDVRVLDATTPAHFDTWAACADIDIVHDHTNGLIDPAIVTRRAGFVSTHHLTGPPRHTLNCAYVSAAQRAAADGPVIPLPVDPEQHRFRGQKDDYVLFLGRISAHKGAYEAAAFAAAAGFRLVLAGPSWEPEYLDCIKVDFAHAIDLVGEVGGGDRRDLIAGARAVMVLSQPVTGPWGHPWCEPGATVVSEAAVSGTPVIATRNGCLPELVPGVGRFVECGSSFTARDARDIIDGLPEPQAVRQIGLQRWHYMSIARQYEELYRRVLAGDQWGDARPAEVGSASPICGAS
ncbi:MAG: glycosyltransferase [Streptomycetales bacterium]